MLKLIRFLWTVAFILFFWLQALQAQDYRAPHPALAVVRISSHGASGTVVATSPQRSWILSCAHMYFGKGETPSPEARARKHVIHCYPQPTKQTGVSSRLILWDHKLDLSLIEIDAGPFYFVPVAPAGFRPGRELWSIGYDEMKWPITARTATIIGHEPNIAITREPPWHGRSGGALIDPKAGLLIGVVCAYTTGGPFDRKPKDGIYVSHDAILRFLARAWPKTNQPHPRQVQDWRPILPMPRVSPPGLLCPT